MIGKGTAPGRSALTETPKTTAGTEETTKVAGTTEIIDHVNGVDPAPDRRTAGDEEASLQPGSRNASLAYHRGNKAECLK